MQTFSVREEATAKRFKRWLEGPLVSDERDMNQGDERILAGEYLMGGGPDVATLRSLAWEVIEERRHDIKRPLKDRSVSGYDDRIKRFGPLADVPFEDITKDMVMRHVTALRTEERPHTGRPYSASVIRETVSFMRSVGLWAVRTGRSDLNPFVDVPLPSGADKKVDKFLTVENYAEIRRYAPSPQFRDMMDLIACATGARVGEVLALRVNDLGREGGYRTLRIDETFNALGKYDTPKNKKPRTLDLDDATGDMLDRYAFGREPLEPLFPHFTGNGPVPYGTFSSGWDRMIHHALKGGVKFPHGFPTPHWLRHTYAGWYLAARDEEGVYLGNIYDLQERLGHSSIQITIDRYGHKVPQARDRAYRATSAVRRLAFGQMNQPACRLQAIG
jgi:integrase